MTVYGLFYAPLSHCVTAPLAWGAAYVRGWCRKVYDPVQNLQRGGAESAHK